jgi:hypothetical protein
VAEAAATSSGPASRSAVARVTGPTRAFARRALGISDEQPAGIDGRVGHLEVVLDDAYLRLVAVEALCRDLASAVDHNAARFEELQVENQRLRARAQELGEQLRRLEESPGIDG